ncbi:MAG TPA: phosphate regulon transcriptional regulatory protein PhoB [Devosia sp.]|nr:phosphate regulon transcriptional regulatory protein PhoB [Devosia sp.]
MPALILVVEDQRDISTMLRYNLEAAGYRVVTAMDGDEADELSRQTIPDLILLDWMLPGPSGIELCRRWRAREETKNVPIIMLTARGVEEEKVRGLKTGADDYVVKPFSVPELLARIEALLRRANPELEQGVLKAGDMELDTKNHRLYRAGKEITLAATEFRLLEFLMRHPGRVYSRTQLLDNIWGREIYVDERTVDVHIGRLRKVINRGKKTDPIRTVRGTGYAFDERFGAKKNQT